MKLKQLHSGNKTATTGAKGVAFNWEMRDEGNKGLQKERKKRYDLLDGKVIDKQKKNIEIIEKLALR